MFWATLWCNGDVGILQARDVLLSVFYFKQKTAYEMRISDWSSDVCSSDLPASYGGAAVVVYVGGDESGIFVRGRSGTPAQVFCSDVEPRVPILENLIGKKDKRDGDKIFSYQHPGGLSDPSAWPDPIDWQEDQLQARKSVV